MPAKRRAGALTRGRTTAMARVLRPPSGMRAAAVVAGAFLILAASLAREPQPARAAAPLIVAFTDSAFSSPDAETRQLWLGRARQANAGMIRGGLGWGGVAPAVRPAGFKPENPGDPAYRWEGVDRMVRSVAASGMQIFLTVGGAPPWATRAAGRPKGIRPGAWRPSAKEFRRFAVAVGRRYNGSYPDPERPGRKLPRVKYFEVWNEPNLDIYLAPQWEGRRATGAILYRGLLNAFYAGVKRANPRARVVAGATAPYGDEPGGNRIRPVVFLKRLLCMRAPARPVKPCRQKPRFDIYSHHGINVSGPARSALDLRDAATPDLGRIRSVLRRARRQGLLHSRGALPALWNTEMWWDSNPPDPDGVPLRRHARWLQQALWLTWRDGGRVATYFQLRDGAPVPDYPSTLQSGLYFADGRAKPALRAMTFPFVGHRRADGRIGVWGIAPRGGKVRIERRIGGRWRVVRRLRARGAPQTFTATLAVRGRATLRAVGRGGHRSLAWRQRN